VTTWSERLRGVGASWMIGVLAASLRVGFVLAHSPADHVFSDMWVYDHRARNLLSGQLTAWDTFTPCGYPWLLSVMYRLWPASGPLAVGVLQAVLGGACAALTHRIGLRLWQSHWPPLAAGLLTALHVPLVLYSGFLMTETIAAFLIVLTTLGLLRGVERRAPGELLWAGVCLGAAAVVRPNLLPFYPLLGLWLWPAMGSRRRALLAFGFVLLGSLPVLGAAAAHNSRLLGRPSLLGSNGGLNFYLNFSEVRTIRYRDRQNDHTITPLPNRMRYRRDERSHVPFYDEGHYYRLGLERIAERPARLWRAGRNLPAAAGLGKLDYWPGWKELDPFLERASLGFFYAAITPSLLWLLLLGGSGRLFRPEHRLRQLLVAWLATCAVVAWLFLGDPRLRVPFDALWILLAVDAYAALGLRLRRWRPG
jgi:4-amino-4-deoxy-L-arabinose transferase-like glycosyltransferase